MKLNICPLNAALALMALTACTQVGQPIGLSGAHADHNPSRLPAGSSTTVYALNVGGSDGSVTVYAQGGAKLVRSIPLGPIFDHESNLVYMTATNAGYLFTESSRKSNPQDGSLTIYQNKGAKKVTSVDVPGKYHLLTADHQNNVYTVCGVRVICEYSSEGKLMRKFGVSKFGLTELVALATDEQGDLAVVSQFSAAVFPPGAVSPTWTIGRKAGLESANSAVFDSSGNLYIADNSIGVFVFAHGGSLPSRTIDDRGATAVTSDDKGALYVLNESARSVFIYAPGQDSPQLTIDSNLNEPVALSVDSSGNVYVANTGESAGGNDIPVFSATTGKLERTITDAIQTPVAVSSDS